jgi:hypothetical protein
VRPFLYAVSVTQPDRLFATCQTWHDQWSRRGPHLWIVERPDPKNFRSQCTKFYLRREFKLSSWSGVRLSN